MTTESGIVHLEGREFFDGADCRLSAVTMGDPAGPVMVLVHGMRDHALSMQVVAEAFPGWRCILPDLRGHGDSDNPGSYSILKFLADLEALVRHFSLEDFVLVGHSLGGHISVRYAALYPERIRALVLIDGMGPPRGPEVQHPPDMERWRGAIDAAVINVDQGRVMADVSEALTRLRRNNPRLDAVHGHLIASEGVRPVPGGVTWKWDPRVDQIWMTFAHADTEAMCGSVTAPVLLLTGDASLDYWVQAGIHKDAFPDNALAAEAERRVRLFPRAEAEMIPGAGHMVQYDEPAALGAAITRFLERKLA